jgi:hypothetical protein
MNSTIPGLNNKIRIHGIKLSPELVQVNLLNRSPAKDLRPLFFQLLSQNQINIPFLLLTGMGEKILGSCCVAVEDVSRIERLVAVEPLMSENIEFISAVGALSIFPHHSNLKLLGLCFYLFSKAGLPLHGMASSISSLTFITDYLRLDEAVTTLLEYVDLPANYAPFRPEIHVIQRKRQ